MKHGLLISFEGVDGCGKSTQLSRLATRLHAAGCEPLLIREPGGTSIGEHIRSLLLDPSTGDIAPATEALLYAASRAELVATTIEPALAAGRIVLADRFVDSSLAYQGHGRALGVERVLEANLLATGGRLPDVTILLDLDPATAKGRRISTGQAEDRLEQAGLSFFTRVRESYLQLAERWPQRMVTIDASGSAEKIEMDIDAALRSSWERYGITLDVLESPV